MDQRERSGDFTEALRTAMDGRQAKMWTALPGIIQSFNRGKMTAVVQTTVHLTALPGLSGAISKWRRGDAHLPGG
jgi:hypothetical protein